MWLKSYGQGSLLAGAWSGAVKFYHAKWTKQFYTKLFFLDFQYYCRWKLKHLEQMHAVYIGRLNESTQFSHMKCVRCEIIKQTSLYMSGIHKFKTYICLLPLFIQCELDDYKWRCTLTTVLRYYFTLSNMLDDSTFQRETAATHCVKCVM